MNKIKQLLTRSFYPTMKDWCEGNNFSQISPSMLPEYTFVIYDESDTALYSVCFYNTDSNLAWLGFELKNPETTKEQREGKLQELFEFIEQYAKAQRYDILFTTSNTPPVEKVMKDSGFIVGDTGVSHYLKII